MDSYYTFKGDALYLNVYLQPGARFDKVIGCHGGALKISVKAPAIEGEANQNLIRYLAKLAHVARTQVSIEKGLTRRHKWVKITGISELPTALVV